MNFISLIKYLSKNFLTSFVNLANFTYKYLKISFLTISFFYFSLIISAPVVNENQQTVINRTISVLEARGFTNEVVILRHFAIFRTGDNWLNSITGKENVFASTNFPFGIVTIYPDFFNKTTDDTERAMILLHEAQHLQGKNEAEAYSYVWENRQKLDWTVLSHGTTEIFVTIELLTREHSPEIFTCSDNFGNDCTEKLKTKTALAKK